MRFPSLRISLLTLFIVVAIAGPGAGFAIRQWRERERTSHRDRATRMIETYVAEAQQAQTGLDHQEFQLKQVSFMVDSSEIFTSEERVALRKQLDMAIRDVRTRQSEKAAAYRHSCYPELNRTDATEETVKGHMD